MTTHQPLLKESEHANLDPDPATDELTDTNDSPRPAFGLPIPRISKRQALLLVGILLIAFLAWQLRSPSNGSTDAESENQSGEDGGGSIEVPLDPTDPLKGDDAVVEGLKHNGVIGE